MAEKENEANELRGADMLVMLSSRDPQPPQRPPGGGHVGHVVVIIFVLVILVIVQLEVGDVVERWEGGVGDNDDYDNDNWTNGREGERR